MRPFFKYLASISCMLLTLCLYIEMAHTPDVDPNGINIEAGMHTALHKQNNPDFSNARRSHNKILIDHKNHKRIQHAKHIGFDAVVAKNISIPILYVSTRDNLISVVRDYHYLYYREINPPPPKCC